MSARRRVSPGVARRRALVFDLLCAAMLALVALTVAAGIGVVGVGAVIVLLLALVWLALEALVARVRRRSY